MNLIKQIKTIDNLHEYAKNHTLDEVKNVLRKYVDLGQPDGFSGGATSRAMCRHASLGLEGIDGDCRPYLSTKYGSELYFYMWGSQ